ncbi:actin-related protein 2/3 complex subunit 3-like [Hibiscus syriacus]|uniref:actin-related protein 2/3 complex subunit 3-like n=1 Tax=Hibiscus syriacus TaxID=106335 RepID=UPI001923EA85|nr:actin-related protein 2/3 complex subunit 3-like [Hibiscus syriacus]
MRRASNGVGRNPFKGKKEIDKKHLVAIFLLRENPIASFVWEKKSKKMRWLLNARFITIVLLTRKELLKLVASLYFEKAHKWSCTCCRSSKTDIVDEAITFFRANVSFRNFEIKSPGDKLLIYWTFYINVALKRLEGCRTLAEGTKAIINLGLEDVPTPGESGFPFLGLFVLPYSQKEAELLRNYLKQIREETSGRLFSVAYRPNGTPNKWWLAFAKKKSMNILFHERYKCRIFNQK